MVFEWTDDAVEKMRELRGAGRSYRAIGIALGGVSSEAVRNKITRLGWDKSALKALSGGSWTEERIQKARELWDAGYSAGAIGAELGLSGSSVRNKIERLGWKCGERLHTVTVGRTPGSGWSDDEVRVLKEFMLNSAASQDSGSVYVEVSKRLPGRNPDAIRKKYAAICREEGLQRPDRWDATQAAPVAETAKSASTEVPVDDHEGGFQWTEEKLDGLRKLWDAGLSAAQIGARLGTTKNAVVGKADRLDLPDRQHLKAVARLPKKRPSARRFGTPLPWSDAEDDQLRELVADQSCWDRDGGFDVEASRRLPGRSPEAVHKRRRILKLVRPDHIVLPRKSGGRPPLPKKQKLHELPKQQKQVALAASAEPEREEETEADGLGYWSRVVEVHDGCCWPIGELGSSRFRWCGRRVMRRKSSAAALGRTVAGGGSTFQWETYCVEHVLKSYNENARRALGRFILTCEAA